MTMSGGGSDTTPPRPPRVDSSFLQEISSAFIAHPGNFERPSILYQNYPGAERLYYDYAAERSLPYATNIAESTAHLIKGCLGAGLLSIHIGFMHAGLWTALLGTIVTTLLMCNAMKMLVRSAHFMYVLKRVPKMTYPDLMEAAVYQAPFQHLRKCHKFMRHTIDVFLFVQMCGSCCIYEIMIAKTIRHVVSSSYNIYNLRIYLLIVAVPLIAICMIRNLKYLAPFSIFADFIIGFCILIAIYYSLRANADVFERPGWKSLRGLRKFQGICLYAVDGIGITLPIENSMKSPKYFFVVVQYGMSVVGVCVAMLGFFGYMGCGEECMGPITVHLPRDNFFAILLQVLLMVMLAITFAINLWVTFKVVWHYLWQLHGDRHIALWERFYKAMHVILITMIALVYPNLNRLIIFYGNFCSAFLAFVFPALIELMVYYDRTRQRSLLVVKNVCLVVIGLLFIPGAVV